MMTWVRLRSGFLTNFWSRWPSESPTVSVHPRLDTLSLHMMQLLGNSCWKSCPVGADEAFSSFKEVGGALAASLTGPPSSLARSEQGMLIKQLRGRPNTLIIMLNKDIYYFSFQLLAGISAKVTPPLPQSSRPCRVSLTAH